MARDDNDVIHCSHCVESSAVISPLPGPGVWKEGAGERAGRLQSRTMLSTPPPPIAAAAARGGGKKEEDRLALSSESEKRSL